MYEVYARRWATLCFPLSGVPGLRALQQYLVSVCWGRKKKPLCVLWGNAVNLVPSTHTGDLFTYPGMSLIYCGSMKETRPLVLWNTTQEEIRLQQTGKKGKGGKEKDNKNEMGTEGGDGWWMSCNVARPVHATGACRWCCIWTLYGASSNSRKPVIVWRREPILLTLLLKSLATLTEGQQGYSTWLRCQTHRLLEKDTTMKLNNVSE